MPTFSSLYGTDDVQGSINLFIKNNLGTNVPAWMTWNSGAVPPRTLNFDYPEVPINFPSFSVTHLGNDDMSTFEGDHADGSNKGVWKWGLMEIDCWETSNNNSNWMWHLRVMRDMVVKLFLNNRAIPIYNLSNPASPVSLNSIARIEKVWETGTTQDPNPAVKRKRILVKYHWVERI